MRSNMTGKEMWDLFASQEEMENVVFEEWAFGDAPDQLADLVKRGIKTATSSAYPLYGLEGEALPEAGEYSVILNSEEEGICVIRTTNVSIVPFREVDELHAYKEGEGDRSLQYWRTVHEDFFTKCMREAGLQFEESMNVVCEEFEVVYPQKK